MDEHNDARPLIEWVAAGPLPTGEVIEILRQAAAALAPLHATGKRHGGVNPARLAWSRALRQLRLPPAEEPGEGEQRPPPLAWSPPEVGGLLERRPDERADLYSLGATAWHLLVGRPPFLSADPLELLHAHVARSPSPPDLANPAVPPSAGALVMRLLAKQPEERYQSAAGLLHDLGELERRLATGSSAAFELGTADAPRQFRLSMSIYGQEGPLSSLRDALDRARGGWAPPVMVLGAAGTGKSTLARGLAPEVVAVGGAFARARAAPGPHRAPFQLLADGLRDALRQVLSEGEHSLQRRRPLLRGTLGSGAGALLPLLPELGRVLGPVESAPSLGAEETRIRAQLLLSRLLRALASPERPLVLALDDVHLADGASLEVLGEVATDHEAGGLLQLWCLDTGHPGAVSAQSALGRSCAEALRISPTPLGEEALTRLVRDTFACAAPQAQPLAALLLRRSRGNPFVARATLTHLHTRGLLTRGERGWGWELSSLEGEPLPDDVVGVLRRLILSQPAGARALAPLAAALGRDFDLETLATLAHRPAEEIARDLAPLIEAGVVEAQQGGPRLHFTHPRLAQAAWEQLPEQDRPAVHLTAARALRARLGADVPTEPLLVALGHFAHAGALLPPEEACEVAGLAELAAARSAAAGAFDSALALYELGITTLGPSGWETSPERATALHLGGVQAAFAAGARPTMEAWVEAALPRVGDLARALPLWSARIRARVADNQMLEAMAVAEEFLQRVGRPSPREVSWWRILGGLVKTQLRIGLRTPEELAGLPAATDPLAVAVQEIQTTVAPAHFVAAPERLPLMILRDVEAVLRDGTSAYGAQCWTGYALLLRELFGAAGLAERYSRLALAQVERLGRREVGPRLEALIQFTLSPWTSPLHAQIQPLRRTSTAALEVGEVNFGLAAAHLADAFSFHSGEPLADLAPTLRKTLRRLERYAHRALIAEHRPLLRQVELLTESAPPDGPFPWIPPSSGDQMWAQFASAMSELHLALIFGHTRRALELALPVYDAERALAQSSHAMPWRTYLAVALHRAVWEGLIPASRVKARARALLRCLQGWTRHAPGRAWLLQWVEAETLAAAGEREEALETLGHAIHLAQAQGHLHDVALMSDHAARICERHGESEQALHHHLRALSSYQRWGASAAVARQRLTLPPEARRALPPPPDQEPAQAASAERLDLRGVIRAAQALSEEVVYPTLVRRLLTTLLETSGATRVALIRVGPEGPRVEALRHVQDSSEALTPPQPLEGSDHVPVGLVLRVLRTGEAISLPDVSHEGEFTHLPYVRHHQSRSLLCAPLLRAGEVRGALLLENPLVSGAFTAARREAIQLLAAQAIISLENASVLGELEARVAQRTHELEEARDRAERASQARRQFLANMTHELRTPLSAILGHTQRLLQEGGSPPRTTEGLVVIERSGRHLLSLIDDVLDLARIDAQRLELLPSECDPQALLGAVVALLEPAAQARGLALRVDVGEELPRWVWLDPRRLHQILVNLAGNAIKCTPTGQVTLRLRARPGDRADGARLRFEVQDTGLGIPEERHAEIFLPFEQAGPTEQRARGTGLGLAISARLVEQMGGRLTVQSEVGQGSIFAFELDVRASPLRVAARALVAPGEAAAAPPLPHPGELPEPVREELLQLAARGNLSQVAARARALRSGGGPGGALLDRIEKLADDFEDREILRLLGGERPDHPDREHHRT